MISLYNYTEYRPYIRDRFAQMPKEGYGQALRLAGFLGVHTTYMSQIMKGTKSFSLEQAAKASEFFGHNEAESDYFLGLVELDKAGSDPLKKIILGRLEKQKNQASELIKRLKASAVFDEQAKARFYSDWSYSAVRQLIAIDGFQDPDAIALRLNLPLKNVNSIISFLLIHGLCKEVGGKLVLGPTSTHLESSSPWVGSHHRNWRARGMETFAQDSAAKLYYSCPMTISKEDALKVREQIITFLESLDPLIEKSTSEEFFCLNIDWFVG